MRTRGGDLLRIERCVGDIPSVAQILDGIAGERERAILAGCDRPFEGALHDVLRIALVGLTIALNRPFREVPRCRGLTESALALGENTGLLAIGEWVVPVLVSRLGRAVPGAGR